ncbi:MAG: MgtC/SapB family protein [Phycisphaerales bacterium]|nr:MgtC/SapB family protein [Phycisphaerales bacterium]
MDWLVEPNVWPHLGRLGVAAILGGLIGLEREHHGRGAGLRTQILVSLGAALAALVSLLAVPSQSGGPQVDAGRMAYGIMAGVGFLGGGVIIHSGMTVRGLTTAASLWCTAAVGLACGFGIFVPAIACTLIVLATLIILGKLEPRIPTKRTRRITIVLPIDNGAGAQAIEAALSGCDVRPNLHASKLDYQNDTQTLRYSVSIHSKLALPSPCKLAEDVPGIRSIEIE